jgi:predicted PurR-regulated permease PerM
MAKRAGWAAPVFTSLIGILVVVPVGYALVQFGLEIQHLAHQLTIAQKQGLPPPDWLGRLPGMGASVLAWWNSVLGAPGGISEWLKHLEPGALIGWAKAFGAQMLHRSAIFVFTLLALYFLYRDGARIGEQTVVLLRKALGADTERRTQHAIAAIRATVNGLVLVGIGEGILLGLAYALAGIPSPAVWGAITGVLAMIPFAAPIVFGGASLFLFAQGDATGAALLFGWGMLVLFVADHFVRPILIGSAAKLPFLWVLLGILGGLETLGLLGLFLGPVVMAMGVALWREWTEEPA